MQWPPDFSDPSDLCWFWFWLSRSLNLRWPAAPSRVLTEDGHNFFVFNFELGGPRDLIGTSVIYYPKGTEFVASAPEGRQPARWSSKFAVTGMGWFDQRRVGTMELLHRASHRTGHADHASGSLDLVHQNASSSWADTCGVLSSSHRVFSDTSRPVNQETG